MADDVNQEILRELKKINEKLDRLEEPQGLSTPMKLLALFLGVIVLGPVFSYLLFFLIY
ncbi:hypothetical protein [Salisediminibacterium selenitireducens]|uniref:Uncharacterized protein n=1 Tax=Bacillus selenitireducens (strain ATCC 700615 / DSM 15326 / MLS10) TaxID=439292 RepID=D6Y0W5_BACIE|nr:hypothetical protein [Salisediminibacterium selenitireducens]ADI00683.1 hypothetical protein Bsel_3201 [[Bacillus] selenitireducens MLS10]